MALYRYFQPSGALPNPSGPLSAYISPAAIKDANEAVMRTYKNKNTNIYSEGLTAIYTKICTFQNFPLY